MPIYTILHEATPKSATKFKDPITFNRNMTLGLGRQTLVFQVTTMVHRYILDRRSRICKRLIEDHQIRWSDDLSYAGSTRARVTENRNERRAIGEAYICSAVDCY